MTHYNLNVKDLDASLKFYKGHLNMKEAKDMPPKMVLIS